MTDAVDERCVDCGADGCTAVFDELLALEFTPGLPFGRWHAITVAAYGVQHPSRFGPDSRRVQWAFLRMLDEEGLPAVERLAARLRAANSHRHGGLRVDELVTTTGEVPEPPVGAATIRDVLGPAGTLDADGHDARMEAWAHDLVVRSGDRAERAPSRRGRVDPHAT